jgi:F0F1-type ATP synthase membrane subunit b/b'
MGWMGWVAVGFVVWVGFAIFVMSFPIIAARTDRRDRIIRRRRDADNKRNAAIATWRRRGL